MAGGDFALNPFVRGCVLDLGCGLGNLSIDAPQNTRKAFSTIVAQKN